MIDATNTMHQQIDWDKDWREIEFERELHITDFSRGRSAANFCAESYPFDAEDKIEHYTIFLTDFLDMLLNEDIDRGGWIAGTFIVKKRGNNFGIRLKSTPVREDKRTDYTRLVFPVPRYL